MRRTDVLTVLRRRQSELGKLGVGRLYLYGSVARDDADADSDVDLLVDPNDERFSLFDLMRAQDACSKFLGRRAELHDYRGLKRAREFGARVGGDLVNVF
jgi:predicted nucleotidyltransferase